MTTSLRLDVDPPIPSADQAEVMAAAALAQFGFARRYTLELLEATPRELWTETPPHVPSNIAWQVGHLTVSQYGLLLFRIRGRTPEDLDLIPGKFRKSFARGSTPKTGTPKTGTASCISPDDLLDRLDRVHRQAERELAEITPTVLLEPIEMPYAVYPVKLGAILFCPLHEQIHAGQIGLIRRALGLDPVR